MCTGLINFSRVFVNSGDAVYMTAANFHNHRMCDSPVVPSVLTLGVLSKCSRIGANYRKSVSQVDAADEFQSKSQLLERKSSEEVESCGSSTKSSDSYLYRSQLEQDVQILQQQLQEELDLHAILESAIKKNAVELSTPSLPHHAQELLSNLAVLDLAVTKLEDEMVSLQFQLSQERNERRLTEYRLRHLSPQPTHISPPDNVRTPRLSHKKHPLSQAPYSSDDNSPSALRDRQTDCTSGSSSTQMVPEDDVDSILSSNINSVPVMHETKDIKAEQFKRRPRGMPPKGLWDHPNLLSEEMVRCMRNIFISLADSCGPSKSPHLETKLLSSSPRGHFSNSSWWSSERSVISSWVQSPQIDVQNNSDVLASENAFDPYRVRGKLSWVDIGNYGSATEVSWMSVGKQQLEYASGALRKFRTLVEQLAKVNPIHLSGDEKLAFWINLYNALIMHAYLAYGVPRSDLKLFSLMQKAAYTVGGNSFSAAAIEYVILKMKPPGHRPQIALLLALHKLKITEEQRKSALDTYEPLVAFALSCGMYSSPAVRIYTPRNIRGELQDAQRDFIQASVGVSNKGKLLVPKMIHCFTKGFVDDANLAVWISHFLPPHQAAFVEQCISQRRQSLLGSRNCGILPFDSHFRYLFLPEIIPENWSN